MVGQLARRILVVAMVLVPVAGTMPGHAAVQGSVLAGTIGGGCEIYANCLAWQRSCDARLAIKDNAIGSSVANIATYAGKKVKLTASMGGPAQPDPKTSGRVGVTFYSSSCVRIGSNLTIVPVLKSATFTVPSATRWVTITPSLNVFNDYRWKLVLA